MNKIFIALAIALVFPTSALALQSREEICDYFGSMSRFFAEKRDAGSSRDLIAGIILGMNDIDDARKKALLSILAYNYSRPELSPRESYIDLYNSCYYEWDF